VDNISTEAEWNNYQDDFGFNSVNQIRCHKGVIDPKGNQILGTYIKGKNVYSKIHCYQNNNPLLQKRYKINAILNLYLYEKIPEYLINRISDTYINKNVIYRKENQIGALAAITYFILKKDNIEKNVKEIADIFKIGVPLMNKFVTLYNNDFRSEFTTQEILENTVNTICSRLNISSRFINVIHKLSIAILKLDILKNVTTNTLLGSIILFIIHEKNIIVNLDLLIEIISIQMSTLQRNYRIILENKQILFTYMKQHMC
jgi:hypothetical protein